MAKRGPVLVLMAFGWLFVAGCADGSTSGLADSAAQDDARSTGDASLADPSSSTAAAGVGDAEPAISSVASQEAPPTESIGQVTSDDSGEASLNPGNPTGSKAQVTIDAVRSTSQAFDTTASDGSKFVSVEFQTLGLEKGAFLEQAFRLQAEGEWYSPLNNINQSIAVGEIINQEVIFEVPETARDLVLEVGALPAIGEGWTSTYQIILGT